MEFKDKGSDSNEGDLRFESSNPTDRSPSSSSCTDPEDSSSENLRLSMGYFPREDTSSKNTISMKTCLLRVLQSSLPLLAKEDGALSLGRLLGGRGQIRNDPEQLCKRSIPLAWDVDVDSGNSDWRANWDLSGDKHWADKYPEEKTHRL
ncbi:hypothetical protein MC885_021871 [Smutsia gigantea]|nr:hypothetical protein MC885_021871 [Smutsia gigantea]